MSKDLITFITPADMSHWSAPFPNTTASGRFQLGDTTYRPIVQPQYATFELNTGRRDVQEFRLVGVFAERTSDSFLFYISATNLNLAGAILRQVKVDGFQMTPKANKTFMVAETVASVSVAVQEKHLIEDTRRRMTDYVLQLKEATFSDLPEHMRSSNAIRPV